MTTYPQLPQNLAGMLLRPRITEKATLLQSAEKGPLVYTFEVHARATKNLVAQAVKSLYKVTPTAVRIIKLPAKTTMARGGVGSKTGVKKALVTLKPGEKIESL
ncbi:MAG: 50S ribosomal protein L23 [Parcubacteria group bacterium RIFOXYD2_FULL_52_8]|nr:MAG: 50S ribosomal protein L23 [Parcubacteria group bacterium RIFOXYD2_FULL_52_8]